MKDRIMTNFIRCHPNLEMHNSLNECFPCLSYVLNLGLFRFVTSL